MSNYKYAIKKLPIKSWIKYWLWRNRTGGTKYKFALSEIKEGSNFYLENTIKRKFNMFELFGKTTQDGTPTPENPIPIVNLTGNINEKIENKNFAPFTNQDFTVQGVEFKVINGTLYLNGTSTGEILTNRAEFKNNFSFILKAGTYKFSRQNSNSTAITISIKRYSDNENIISLVNAQNNSVDLTLAEDTKVYLGFYIYQKTFTNEEFAIQIEQGTTASTYIPHAEQNISFPLAEGQVFAEGDYLADDGIHHVRGILDLSTLTWNEYTTTTKYRSQTINNIKIPETQATIPNILAEKYRARMQNGTFANGEIGIANNGQLIVCDETGTPSGIFEYDLAEEYVEPFTEEQQIEYNKIKELYTYNEITNIDGDANLKIKYWERVER